MGGQAMQCIRFPAMSVEEFADFAVKSDMLDLQEITDIFLNFTAKEKPILQYPVKQRLGMRPQVCHRFQSSAYRSNQWRYRGRCDSIQFCVDRRQTNPTPHPWYSMGQNFLTLGKRECRRWWWVNQRQFSSSSVAVNPRMGLVCREAKSQR